MTIPHGPLSSANFIQAMAKNTGDKRLAQVLTGMSVLMVALMIYREGKEMLSERHSHAERLHHHRAHRHHAPHEYEGHLGHVERLHEERGHHHGHGRGVA